MCNHTDIETTSAMDNAIKIFTLLSPFIAVYLVYILGIKGKRKDTDFEKEKELNTVLSNLLLVWNYLTRIEVVIDLMADDNPNSIVPKKYYPVIILQTGILNDKCFQELDSSINLLKKYDPLIFFKLEGIGNTLHTLHIKYIMPFFKNPNTQSDLIDQGAGTVLNETLTDLEEQLEMVAGKINSDTLAQVRTYIQNHLDRDDQEILTEINTKYYELMMQVIPETFGKKTTLAEFIELAKSEEYKKVFEFQFDIVANNTLEDVLDIVAKHPDFSIDEVQVELERRQQEKKNGST